MPSLGFFIFIFLNSIFLVNQTPGRNLNSYSCFPLSKHRNVIDELAAGYLPTSMPTLPGLLAGLLCKCMYESSNPQANLDMGPAVVLHLNLRTRSYYASVPAYSASICCPSLDAQIWISLHV